MKKFNYIILSSILIYLMVAFFTGNAILNVSQQVNKNYQVEINRILNQITSPGDIDHINLQSYESIQQIEFLHNPLEDKETTNTFFHSLNDSIKIVPLYNDNELLGYIKFTYVTTISNISIFYITQIGLFLLEVTLIIYLLYIRKHILIPFQQVNTLPIQLANGHLKGLIKEEKGKYFHQFLMGMGQLKDNLESSNKRQLELMKEKKKMLLSLSHDIKTPLNLIKLYDKALLEELYTYPEEKYNALIQIKNKADEIEVYIQQIIQSSREDLFDFKVVNEDFYLKDLITNILNVYQEQCALRHIDLSVSPYTNRLLKGDKERSQEVIENLFENAFKYGDGRNIEISFYEEDYCQLICFYNTGKSVPDHEFNHLFDSFFRASNATGKSGNGLGLYICKELMRKMDGDIFAKQEKEGISFILVFR